MANSNLSAIVANLVEWMLDTILYVVQNSYGLQWLLQLALSPL